MGPLIFGNPQILLAVFIERIARITIFCRASKDSQLHVKDLGAKKPQISLINYTILY